MSNNNLINRNIWVYDIETLKSCFTYSAINIDTLEIVSYVIHKDLNQLEDLLNHLKLINAHIGFNNINFDYPIIHKLILKRNLYLHSINYSNPDNIVKDIYKKAQEIINNQGKDNYFSSIKPSEVLIFQLDLYKIWHYDNKARATSLKSLEISMNYPNVQDMPIDHDKNDITINDIKGILEYNINDILATFEFYKKSIHKIDLRKTIKSKYSLNCFNYSDSKIGEELVLKLYCQKTGLNPYDVKKLRSFRNQIIFKDIIFDYINFKSKEFNQLLNKFKNLVITETKGAFKESVIYKGFQYDYGTGGIHGCIKSGIYESDDNYIIIDADVGSLYPNIAIKNRLYIEHLGEIFIDIYDKDIVQERLRAKKAGDISISDALKLSANSVYGKSNDKNSFLYDPKYTMATTINGQLLLTMLAEEFVDNIKNITVLQINTDGITVKIPKSEEDKYYKICQKWEELTKLSLEYVEYSKMVIRDVNNYAAMSLNEVEIKNGNIIKKEKIKAKYKGAFEIDKVVGNEPAYHKDNSFRIIPYALSEYFFKNIPVETTIKNHKNIYDFCGRQKFNRDSYGEIHYIDNFNEKIEKQQKNVRYYISKSGKTFVKQYSKGSSEIINKGFQVEIFNNYIEKENYNIDYRFYISEANKIINIIENNQLMLF